MRWMALSDAGGADDATTPEPASARQSYMPSSTGLSLLIGGTTKKLKINVRWGDYKLRKPKEGQAAQEEWERRQQEQELTIDIPEKTKNPRETEIRGSGGLKIALPVRQVESDGADGNLPKNTRCASVFLVNRRTPEPDEIRDEAFAFQTQLEVTCDEGFVARPNLSPTAMLHDRHGRQVRGHALDRRGRFLLRASAETRSTRFLWSLSAARRASFAG